MKLPYLQGHLQPIAAATKLPGGARPVTVVQPCPDTRRSPVSTEESGGLRPDAGIKVLRAVYSERQLEEVLTDFWFNHFNVDARKIEDRRWWRPTSARSFVPMCSDGFAISSAQPRGVRRCFLPGQLVEQRSAIPPKP